MLIEVVRKYFFDDTTISHVFIDNKFFCFCLEDADRNLDDSMTEEEILSKKIKGETAIPYGTYKVKSTFSNRFQKNLPLIYDVTGFQGIRIHWGNTSADTEGCLLFGLQTLLEHKRIVESRKACEKFMQVLGNNEATLVIKKES